MNGLFRAVCIVLPAIGLLAAPRAAKAQVRAAAPVKGTALALPPLALPLTPALSPLAPLGLRLNNPLLPSLHTPVAAVKDELSSPVPRDRALVVPAQIMRSDKGFKRYREFARRVKRLARRFHKTYNQVE